LLPPPVTAIGTERYIMAGKRVLNATTNILDIFIHFRGHL
jgi:hypothetical protein